MDNSKNGTLEPSPVFCVLPWISANIQPNGKVYACCMADAGSPAGDLRRSSLAQIWNAEGLRRLRRNMLEGRPSAECGKCYALERLGGVSLRRDVNAYFARHVQRATETSADGALDKMEPAYLDIRFSNLCNLKCRYCHEGLSTAWFEDRGTPAKPAKPIVFTPTRDPEDLLRQLAPLLPSVERIYFSGGEPLLAPEHHRLIRDLIASGRAPRVCLDYSTNFSTLRPSGVDLIALWKNFKKVHVEASLDAMDGRGEYIRKNLRWDDVVQNRKLMMSRCPEVGFSIGPTLSALNALHLPEFHWDWVEKGLIGADDIYINILTEPAYYSAQVLPPDLKRRVADKYERHVERVASRFGPMERMARFYRAAAAFVAAEDRTDLLLTFKRQTALLDIIRGERMADVFPELASLAS